MCLDKEIKINKLIKRQSYAGLSFTFHYAFLAIMTVLCAHKKEFPWHDIDATTIEVIDRADTNLKLMVKEMLHIYHSSPALNTQHAAHYKKMNNKDMFKTQLSCG